MLLPILLLAVRISPATPDIPFSQPQIATDGRTVGVAFGSSEGVYFVRSADGGKTFAKPVLVAKGKAMLGRHRGPRIAMTPGAIVISAILRKNAAATASHNHHGGAGSAAAKAAPSHSTPDGDLYSWSSTDGGETWSGGNKINDVQDSAAEGLHAMGAGGGIVFSTWLDLRSKGTRLYGSVSKDGGKTWSKNMLVYESPSGTICQCCHPSVIVDSKGNITVMFRNSLAGSRDMYALRSTNRGESFSAAQKMGEGTWVLNACPMDGGGLAINDKGETISVWRRDKDIYLAAGGGAEKKLGSGKDPAIAIGRAGHYVAWTADSTIQLISPTKQAPATLSNEGAYPQLLALPDGKVLAAWEAKGALAIEVLE
jgi:hypothetical protein